MTGASKPKAAVIVDHGCIRTWQAAALAQCADIIDIVLVLDCRNTRTTRRWFAHAGYYLINFFCLRSAWTQTLPYQAAGAEVVAFDSEHEGAWQRLPDDIIARLDGRVDVVIKFGMNLLRVPPELDRGFGILSYHHGDPEHFRGRPAGFYEVDSGAPAVGVIVQQLSNRLDAGVIRAQIESKIFHHSYKATAANFYKNSVPMLRRAILNAAAGIAQPNHGRGKNYKLPSNARALAFVCKLAVRKLRRWLYGAFVEKRWQVAVTARPTGSPDAFTLLKVDLELAVVPPTPKGYTFLADPFLSADATELYVEALNARTGRGEILALDSSDGRLKCRLLEGGHYSYPQPVRGEDRTWLLPEMSGISSQCVVSPYGTSASLPLRGLESLRLVDATHFEWQGVHYLFACRSDEAWDSLLLFHAPELLGPYLPHPQNPIVVDPARARMAGNIIEEAGRLYRFGQNGRHGYGDGIWVNEILELTPQAYSETPLQPLTLGAGMRGPHTLNLAGNKATFDFYRDCFSPLAGFRRMLNRIAAKT